MGEHRPYKPGVAGSSPVPPMAYREWGRSSVWLERRPVTPEVASSSLVGPAMEKALHSPKSAGLFIYNEIYKLRRPLRLEKGNTFLLTKCRVVGYIHYNYDVLSKSVKR